MRDNTQPEIKPIIHTQLGKLGRIFLFGFHWKQGDLLQRHPENSQQMVNDYDTVLRMVLEKHAPSQTGWDEGLGHVCGTPTMWKKLERRSASASIAGGRLNLKFTASSMLNPEMRRRLA